MMESLEMEGAGAAEETIGPGVFCFVFSPKDHFQWWLKGLIARQMELRAESWDKGKKNAFLAWK